MGFHWIAVASAEHVRRGVEEAASCRSATARQGR